MGSDPMDNPLLPAGKKIRDYLRWPVQAMPKRAAQGSLIVQLPACIDAAQAAESCFLIPGSAPGNASSQHVK